MLGPSLNLLSNCCHSLGHGHLIAVCLLLDPFYAL